MPSSRSKRHLPTDFNQPNATSWLRHLGRIPRSLTHSLHQDQESAPALAPIADACVGEDQGEGNLLGIQAWLQPADAFHVGTYAALWERYFQLAHAKGWLTPKTIVVLPEHVGTWLLFSHEGSMAAESESFAAATYWIAMGRPLEVAEALLQSNVPTPVQKQVFRSKAKRMASQYQLLFGRLARKYKITLVAGSIVLPSPWLQGGKLQIGTGPLISAALVFRPDGTPYPRLLTKANPSRKERIVLTGVPAPDVPVCLETPAGQLHVGLGADAWFRRPTLPPGALLAAPAFALPHRPNPLLFPTSSARAGLLVASHGRLWDTLPSGPILYHQGQENPTWQEPARADKGAILNLWLTPHTL